MSDGQSILLAAAGIVATWYFAHWCYRKSGSDLDAAMRRQHQATNAIGHKLEHKDQVELVFDAAGNVIGNSITVSLSGPFHK